MSAAPGAEQAAPIPYRPDIDGLRAVAVTSVVAYHIWGALVPGGFVGVDIFFVISGFLIGGNIHREVGAGKFSFAAFYARRARRILPALLAMLMLFLLFGAAFYTAREYRELAAEAISSTLGVSNLQFWLRNDYFAVDAGLVPLLMTWSLGVEEQFYVALPGLLLLTARLGGGRLGARRQMVVVGVICAVSLAASVWATTQRPWAAFYLIPFRAWELGLGVAVALWDGLVESGGAGRIAGLRGWRAELAGGLGLALIVAALALFSDRTPFPGWAALVPVTGAGLIIAARSSVVNRRLLASPPFVGIGLISYSWYLWHWPILTILHSAAPTQPSLLAKLGFSALGLGAAWLSWRFVERPFRRGRMSPPQVLRGAATAMVVAVALAGGIIVTGGLTLRLSPVARENDRLATFGSGSCQLGFGQTRIVPGSACMPDPGRREVIAVLGDSHANAFSNDLATVLPADRFAVWQVEKSACLPLLGVTTGDLRRPAQASECGAFLRQAIALLRGDPRVRTVVLAGAWPERDDPRLQVLGADGAPGRRLAAPVGLASGLGRLIDGFNRAGKRVVVIGDVPRVGGLDPMRAARIRAMPLRAWLSGWVAPDGVPGDVLPRAQLDPRFTLTRQMVRDLARAHGAAYFDIADALCDPPERDDKKWEPVFVGKSRGNKGPERDDDSTKNHHVPGCRIAEGGAALFIDRSHLSALGAAQVLASPALAAALRP